MFKDYDYREYETGGNERFLRVVYSDNKEGMQTFFINSCTGSTITITKRGKNVLKAKLRRGDFKRLKSMGVNESLEYIKREYR